MRYNIGTKKKKKAKKKQKKYLKENPWFTRVLGVFDVLLNSYLFSDAEISKYITQ
jgi:hypothetical protein